MTLAILVFTLITFAQNETPTVKVEVTGALVWGDDSPIGSVSSSMRDPLTGNTIHKLSYAGIEVSSRAGFESLGSGRAGELLNFTSTIVNNTETDLSVRQAGASVDGHAALPLSVVPSMKGLNKREREQVWELGKMYCFLGGFLSRENFFSANASSKVFKVAPNSALTVSFVTKDPRNYSLLCSIGGCYPKGTMRFYVTVNTRDYVFIWPGRSVIYCGK